MTLSEKINETIADARKLRAGTQHAFLASLQTELAVARTMCILARQEHGEDRAHHLKQAETAFAMVLELAERVQPSQEVRVDMEQARQEIRMLRRTRLL